MNSLNYNRKLTIIHAESLKDYKVTSFPSFQMLIMMTLSLTMMIVEFDIQLLIFW
jgi:hypothetical protein